MAQRTVILSGKGGAGKSTCAALLGVALTALGRRVLLIDCDIGLRSLDVFTGAQERVVYSWGDVLCGRCALSDALVRCSAGYDLLSAPGVPSPEYTHEAFRALTQSLDAQYDEILIDGPAGLGDGLRLAASGADRALLVSAPDDVSLASCALAVEALRQVGIENVRLVINHFRLKAVRRSLQKNIDDSIDKAGARLIGIIPEDPNLWYFGSGCLPKKTSPAIDACVRIARRFTGDNVPLRAGQLK